MSDADEAFVRHKSAHVVRHALSNARRLHEHPACTAMGKPLTGRTVLLVGAAPTPDVDGELLRTAQGRGAVVLAVNSSSPVLASLGITPDAIVVRESIDMSADVAASPAPLVCLDVCAHPAAWDAAGDRAAWFVPGYPHTMTLVEHTHAPPVFGGSAALTAAVKLAILWGAARIVLIGVSLAYVRGEDGSWLSYHPASPRGDSRSVIEDGMLVTTGNAADDARHHASGQPVPAKRLPVEWVPASDMSGKLPTIGTLQDQRRWLESEAERHGGSVRLHNATKGGAAIVGWRLVELDYPAYPNDPGPVSFPRKRTLSKAANVCLVEALTAEAELQRQAADEMLRPTGPRLDALARLPGLHLGAALPEALAMHKLLDMPSEEREMLAHMYGSLRWAAQEAAGILRGGT